MAINEVKYNLKDIYQSIFGLKAIPYPLLVEENGYFKNPFDGDRLQNIIDSIIGNKPSAYSGQVMNKVVLNDIELANEPLIDLGLRKNIVFTDMVKYQGTVKESMGLKDWSVTIRGVIIGENEDSYPIDELNNLRKICETEDVVEVLCEYLNIFDIFYLAIEDLQLPAFEGAKHIQPYEIKAFSDRITELIIREDEEFI